MWRDGRTRQAESQWQDQTDWFIERTIWQDQTDWLERTI